MQRYQEQVPSKASEQKSISHQLLHFYDIFERNYSYGRNYSWLIGRAGPASVLMLRHRDFTSAQTSQIGFDFSGHIANSKRLEDRCVRGSYQQHQQGERFGALDFSIPWSSYICLRKKRCYLLLSLFLWLTHNKKYTLPLWYAFFEGNHISRRSQPRKRWHASDASSKGVNIVSHLG